MDNKDLSEKERVLFLEGELKRLGKELAQKVREIEVEKALEIVRAKALDMRSSAELSETSTILFQQLKELKIDAIRSGVGIFDDEEDAVELWITSVADDGRLFFVLDYINIHIHPIYENIIEARKIRKSFAVTSLEGKDLLDYYKTMSTYAGIPGRRENVFSEYFYSFFFSAGTINVVSSKYLTDEETDIMLRMANAFGLMYTRFLDLKKLEEQAVVISEEKKVLETTLADLKATQSQLIQSEKMASLGELTAGIAHEIQNPLNFVNNFSDLNSELIEELKTEAQEGKKEKVIAIANDIKANEEKINQHGKRADAIVKGMLQHSRTSSGVKELTDINLLAEEYLKLAYHGLRAKDHSFQVTMKTDFDPGVGKINIVPQDIGRVILNLITNAFYAASAKFFAPSKGVLSDLPPQGGFLDSDRGHNPTVWVTTKKGGDKVLISVRDNGPGIPQKILEKIFQPFFTTKPTGQGTGLGLSLSYDIVKAHGGELKVETKEGEGSTFIVQLPL